MTTTKKANVAKNTPMSRARNIMPASAGLPFGTADSLE